MLQDTVIGRCDDIVDAPVYFADQLTLRAWIMSIWPRLLRHRSRKGVEHSSFYYLDSSRFLVLLARVSGRIARTRIRRLEFGLTETTDESGLPIWYRVTNQDLAQILEYVQAQGEFQEAVTSSPDTPRLSMFLGKKIARSYMPAINTVQRALYLVQLCGWQIRRSHPEQSVPVLFLERAPWLDAITPYVSEQNLKMVVFGPSLNIKASLRRTLPQEIVSLLRVFRYRRFRGVLELLRSRIFRAAGAMPTPSEISEDSPLRVAVEYHGQLNLKHPELHSNLFFWPQLPQGGSDLKLMFTTPNYPLDELTQAELDEFHVSAAVAHPGATKLADPPVFDGTRHRGRDNGLKQFIGRHSLEFKWLVEETLDYQRRKESWTAHFKTHNIKVFVGYDKFEPSYCAAADALQDLGGITVNYMRSYESFVCPENAGSADVMFSFSQDAVDLEIKSGSTVKYLVVTGYLGDHRFPMLKGAASTVRDTLRQNGAEHILAYFDENSSDDGRWRIGHDLTRENYRFLLEKVLAEPWFGLVIKPKTPKTLRHRLGQVAGLLDRAEATGRCFVFEEGFLQGSYPPAAAALAADLAVHGHIIGGTAALEAALAGVPTLILDNEGWPMSPFYRLGLGRVVFKNWQSLWDSYLQNCRSPERVRVLGDWSPMIDDFDPFRDGHAAERMGTYIKWLLEGLRAGLDRETVMADAAERYRRRWGYDKVTVLNSDSPSGDIVSPKHELEIV